MVKHEFRIMLNSCIVWSRPITTSLDSYCFKFNFIIFPDFTLYWITIPFRLDHCNLCNKYLVRLLIKTFCWNKPCLPHNFHLCNWDLKQRHESNIQFPWRSSAMPWFNNGIYSGNEHSLAMYCLCWMGCTTCGNDCHVVLSRITCLPYQPG